MDFIEFARSEGRFGKHFDKDGNPSETLQHANQDRLENWRLLQELAGITPQHKRVAAPAKAKAKPAAAAKKPAAAKPAAAKPAPAKKAAPQLPEGFAPGVKIRYRENGDWLNGTLESVEPAVISLDDDTEIRTTLAILAAGVSEGLIERN